VAKIDGFRLFGVDAHEPSVEQARQSGRYEDVFRGELVSFLKTQPDRAFDAVIALDVVEHFTKEGGLEFLFEMERVSAARTIVATPNGFLPQAPTPDNPFQEHLSGWTAEDLSRRGYEVRGLFGLKWLRGRGHELRVPGSRLLGGLSRGTSSIATRSASLAAGLLACKQRSSM
jgi:hypothetical protein